MRKGVSMSGPFKVTILFLILLGIVLLSVIAGGFSSLYRAEGRVESAKVLLMDTCRERLALLPSLTTFQESKSIRSGSATWDQDIEITKQMITKLTNQKEPLGENQTKVFETLQNNIGLAIKDTLLKLDAEYSQEKNRKFELFKKDLSKNQDELFFGKQKYNYEVDYFNRRVKTFPLFIVAKLFNFDGIVYYRLSAHSFLPYNKMAEK